MKSLTLYKLEGGIGSGKSTALTYIKQNFPKKTDIYFLSEPLEILENYKGHKPLRLLSEIKENCAGMIQLFIMKTLFNYYRLVFEIIPDNAIVIMDRYLDSCLIFNQVLFETNKINSFEKDLLIDICSSYLEKLPKVSKIIYLQRSPEYCLQNITKRGRDYEKWLLDPNNDYVYKLHEVYENTLAKSGTNNVFINTNIDLSILMNELMSLSSQFTISNDNLQQSSKEVQQSSKEEIK